MQWHPLFAHLLRPMLQEYYEVQTDVPVGDLPRQADIVLLRRTSAAPPPFQGIWRHLAPWNVLEFKGPTDDPGLRDLDLLVEVALGIERRLNEDRARQRQPVLDRGAMAWWYLANHLGRRFRADAERLFGQPLHAGAPGLWSCPVLGRIVWLVSRDELPVERESVPLHLVTQVPPEGERRLAQEVASQPGLWQPYAAWLRELHPNIWPEVQTMIRDITVEPLDLRPLIEEVGLKQVIDQVGLKRVMEEIGPARVAAEMGLEWFLQRLTPEQIEELKRRLP